MNQEIAGSVVLLVGPVARGDTSRSPVEQMCSQSSRGRLQYVDYKTRLGLILKRMRRHQKTLVFSNYTNSVKSALPPVVVEVALNGKRVTMEVDTGH